MKNNSDSYQTQLAATCLLLSVADADEILEKEELETIGDILQDFFSINKQSANSVVQEAVEKLMPVSSAFSNCALSKVA